MYKPLANLDTRLTRAYHGILPEEQTNFSYVLRWLKATLITVEKEINYSSVTSNKHSVLAVLALPLPQYSSEVTIKPYIHFGVFPP